MKALAVVLALTAVAAASVRAATPAPGRTVPCREIIELKHQYGLAFLRVRGIQRVRLHADLVMLGRLSLALARARSVPTPA